MNEVFVVRFAEGEDHEGYEEIILGITRNYSQALDWFERALPEGVSLPTNVPSEYEGDIRYEATAAINYILTLENKELDVFDKVQISDEIYEQRWSYPREDTRSAEEKLLDFVEDTSLRDLLNDQLDWIGHPERVSVEATRIGDEFLVTSGYKGTEYDAVVSVVDGKLVYNRPWAESRLPQPPLFGVKLTLINGDVEVLLTDSPKEDPSEYDIMQWGRGGSMWDGVIFENIPGGIEWHEGETQHEFRNRAVGELKERIS